ncbi:MAG: indole-3-glycerol phosphate synthase TrpC [Dehalococcoidales bacterium]|nr:indole-3-glycerol phosphate synthase TrpC [Dehalococcoidales bacterium]
MILDEIVADCRKDLTFRQNNVSLAEMQKLAPAQPGPLDFKAALQSEKGIRLIAEVKKASPSKGIIRPDFDPVEIAETYAINGAAAISVLTEPKYFMGNIAYLKKIKDALGNRRLPLLRKDFIFDNYQIYEARAFGADALLLIAAILTPDKLKALLDLSTSLGMACLVEVHNEKEVETALSGGAEIIGINNRDLQTFKTDIMTTERLRPLVPPGKIVVSESGIKTRTDILKLEKLGVNAVLIGEAFMAERDIAGKMRELL